MKTLIVNLILLFLVVCFFGCVNNEKPEFEESVNDLFVPRIIKNYETYGNRDGALTQAYITYDFENYESIQLILQVTYNPTPILSSGYWKTLGNESIGGNIEATSLKFLGGQGEGPSLGGSFELKDKFSTLFKVIVPLRPINEPKW